MPNGKNEISLLKKEGIHFNQILSGIENISAPIYIVTLNGKIVFANEVCAKLANLKDVSSLVGKKCYEIFRSDNCHTEKCPRISYSKKKWTKNGILSRVVLPDGKIKYLRANHAPIYSKEGKVCAVIELFEDFTEVKESSLKIMDMLVSLAEGDLSKTLQISELHRDFVEIGEVLNTLSISLDLGLRNISDAVNRIADGRFDTEVEWEMPGIYTEIIERINEAIKNAYEVDRDRREALEQLAANLMQFETSADRLRNPLAVIMSTLELKDELGSEKVIETVKEMASRIKKELDEMREEEIKTYIKLNGTKKVLKID